MSVHPLLQNSHGTRPKVVLDDVFPEGIVAISYAAEARTLLVGTANGRLILMSRSGNQLKREQGFERLRFLQWCDTGEFGVAALENGKVVCFDSELKERWNVSLTGDVAGIAMTAFGSHIAVSTEASRVHIVTSDKKEISKFETTRPLEYLQFVDETPQLIGAAEFGHLCCHDLTGKEEWNERIANNVGSMCVTGCGKRILLSAFNHGVQLLNRSGKQQGSFMVDGIPNFVAASANKKRMAVTTLENRIYWLNFEGDLLWACDLSSEPPVSVAVGPLGERMFVSTESGRLLQLLW